METSSAASTSLSTRSASRILDQPGPAAEVRNDHQAIEHRHLCALVAGASTTCDP
jgi:hypothetical protein